MYIAVTPLIHSIRGKDTFTYTLPNNQPVVVIGQLVWIPWRNAIKLGVVRAVINVTAFAKAKSIIAVSSTILPANYRAYLTWFAEFYAISLSHAYSIALPNFTQRTLAAPAQALPPIKQLKHQPQTTYLIQNDQQIIEYIRQVYITAQGPLVVLVPEIAGLLKLATKLNDLQPLCVSSRTPLTILREVFFALLVKRRGCYLGTKRLSLFPLTNAEQIIMVEPEDFSHKQWGLNPRYHVYRLTKYLGQGEPAITYLSYCPRVEQYANHTINQSWLQASKTQPLVRYIDMQGQRQLSWQAQNRLAQAKNVAIWHQHKGRADLLICQNCSTIVPNRQIAVCQVCQSPRLHIQGFGTTDLVEKIQKLFPARLVIEITKDQAIPSIDYAKQPIIIGTAALKNCLDWAQIDYCLVTSVDYLLGLPHFRAHEIVLQQLVWLKYHATELDIQTYVPQHPVFQALSQIWPEQWLKQTLLERQQLHFPPTGERIELRHVKTEQRKKIKTMADLPNDPAWIIDREA